MTFSGFNKKGTLAWNGLISYIPVLFACRVWTTGVVFAWVNKVNIHCPDNSSAIKLLERIWETKFWHENLLHWEHSKNKIQTWKIVVTLPTPFYISKPLFMLPLSSYREISTPWGNISFEKFATPYTLKKGGSAYYVKATSFPFRHYVKYFSFFY